MTLLDLLAPPRCTACGVRAPLPWCDDCRAVARRLQVFDGCRWCAGRCGDGDPACPLAGTGLDRTLAAFRYTDVVAQTIVAAKVAGQHAAWRPLGRHLGARARRRAAAVDAVVPVPTEPGRARRRGFDHTHLLATAVAEVLERPTVRALRVRPGTPDRGRNPRAAASPPIRAVVPLAGRSVLVVDDVLTTGATVRATVAAVRRAGAVGVRAAVLARAPMPAADGPPG